MKRRTLLGAGLAATAAAAAGALPRWRGKGPWRFFTPDEATTVDAICEQLIPADRDPGARQAAVVNYIDIQLTRSLRRYQPIYRRGLAGVDTESRSRFGRRFVQLNWEEQAQVLTGVEKKSQPFFDLVLAHTRQGFYGDPRHGGNRDQASWKMLGLPFPPVRGRMHYEESPKGS
jgi:gluconate 2-dehydrogenase gamma chain